MKQYDIIEFKRKGFISFILGGVLKLFEPKWDFWGWHLAIAWRRDPDNKGWLVLEALAAGVGLNYHSDNELAQTTRFYSWLDVVDIGKANQFYSTHINKKYDVIIYFWTTAQYIFRHFWNRVIPRLLDDRFTCWELVSEFCDEMGKPVESKYDCPIITDILKQLQKPL